jgi:maleate isomerase
VSIASILTSRASNETSSDEWLLACCNLMLVASEQAQMRRKHHMTRHFGMLIPSTNTTCEIEFSRLPADLQVHTARLGKAGNTPFSPSVDADVLYQSKLLGDARVEVIALMQTSASLFADDYDAVTVKRMTEASGVPSLTSAQAVGRALRALGTLRVAMATPYSQDVIARASRYYEKNYGITVMASESLGAINSYAIGKMDANAALAAFERIDRPQIEALVVPGGNFPTMRSIQAWEQQFGKPVITTNQAALWAILRAMAITAPLPGAGRLLAQMPEG